MGRNYLAGTHGDAANAVLAAAGYNFRRLLEWLALLLSIILAALSAPPVRTGRSNRPEGVLHRRPNILMRKDRDYREKSADLTSQINHC